jgi:molybdopterin-guanine dinucleotide biosynthesis protein A
MRVMSGLRSDVAAAILAGGQARRFGGRDKSRLVVGGRTIIVRQLQVLQQVAGEVFVVGPTDGRFDDVGIAVHPDRVAGGGALGGLVTALEVARAGRVIVIACDLPFLEVAVLDRLVELADDHDAAWVFGPRGPEPLIACYQRACRDRLAARLARGERRLVDLASVLHIAPLDAAELTKIGVSPSALANLNTPDDYARIQ